MTIKEAKTLKWGDIIYPSQRHREAFRQGKRVESGVFLGLATSRWFGRNHTLIRVIHKDTATTLKYDPLFWDVAPPPKSRKVKP